MGISWEYPGHTSVSQLRYLGVSEHGGVHSPPVMAVLIRKVMINQWIWRDPMFKQSQTNKNILLRSLGCVKWDLPPLIHGHFFGDTKPEDVGVSPTLKLELRIIGVQ